jgi:hypothetical protein
MAVTYNRYKFVTVSHLKRLSNGHFTSKTAIRRLQKRNGHLESEMVLKIRWNFQKALDPHTDRSGWAWKKK